MAVYTKANAPIPELYAEAVEGAFASKNALMGALAISLGIVKIDGSFPQAGPDKIGETVSVPYFGTLGEYVQRTDGTPATPAAFTTTKQSGTITCGTLGFEMTTWGAASPLPGKSPYEEAAEPSGRRRQSASPTASSCPRLRRSPQRAGARPVLDDHPGPSTTTSSPTVSGCGRTSEISRTSRRSPCTARSTTTC
jgi:hypothetical protein